MILFGKFFERKKIFANNVICVDLDPPVKVWLCFKLCDRLSERNDQLLLADRLSQTWLENISQIFQRI